ncbi:hypothetical protein F4821DRAFT_252717 [Hypoxylon rubiginosum]|uniref:Uncharacterized protein n=1 Tax=Hypoxylon rubiginosum TaxID=110542 RepID=A0ACC0DLU5_9PEZI|nr:hypothetical protein F4821DRAFT_252717 [Hypoxylon rubiginosum]
MERLTFFFDGVDNAPAEEPPGEAPINTVFESTVADTLRQYLQPKDGLSLTNAALAIISLLPETPRPAGLSEEYPILWELCVNAAEQIPYHHVCQMKLARLVIALRHSPKITATYIWDQSRDIKFTSELYRLAETVRDIYNPAYSVHGSDEKWNVEDGKRWVNTMAFYAHLHALNGGMLSTLCTWTMGDAFLSTASTKYDALDCHISAAAQWILCTGQNIFSSILAPEEEDEESLLGNRNLWTMDDWRRWKTGFAAAEREENLQQETRQLAKRSANLMEVLEATMVSV